MQPELPTLSQPRRGLAIDLDGTLLDSMQFHASAWQQAFAAFGLDAPLDWFLLWEGINGRGVIQLTLERLGADLATADRQRLLDLKQGRYETMFRPLPMPGLPALEETLRRFKYPVAIVTGSENRVAHRVLTTIGFMSVVQAIVGGDDVLQGKPAPDPYLKAVQALDIPKSNCLVLENAPEGIKSALAADILCIAVETTLPADQLASANYRLRDLPAFTDFLRDEHRRSGGVGAWRC